MAQKTKLTRRALLKIKPAPHFSWRELACHDGTGYIEGLMRHEGLSFYRAWRRGRKLGKYLEKTRREVRRAQGRKRVKRTSLHVTSAYRTPTYNRKIGGESNSAHLRGYAADISIPAGLTVTELAAICRRVWPSGIGVYPVQRFVHSDYDPVLGRRDW